MPPTFPREKDTQMKLYYAPGTCALAVHIVLEWVGAEYEIEKVDPKSEAYKAINPLGMVPALVDSRPRIMTQADAILKYISDHHPKAGLGADGTLVTAFDLDEMLAFFTGDVHPAFWPFFAPVRFTTLTDEASLTAVKEAAFARVDRVMTYLDGLLATRPYVAGGKRTIADPYAFAMLRWTERLPKTWEAYPNVKPFMDVMYADTGVQAAMAAEGMPLRVV
jgi:glutathione S-transferase